MGHAWLLLAIGRNAFEPDASTTLDEPCSAWSSGSGYSIDSIEWGGLSAGEGAAHFYATEVWNSHAEGTAVFTWFDTPLDVEYNDPHASGGRVGNNCDPPQRCGMATNIDWLRFWWDWHRPFVGGPKPNGARIRDVDLDTCPAGTAEADGCAPDGPAVCSLVHDGAGVPVCSACGGAHGCPCFSDADCDPNGATLAGSTVPLACWGADDDGWLAGPGRCLPAIMAEDGQLQSPARHQERVEFERTAWLCKTNCGALEDATNFDYACWYNQFEGRAFDYAACVDVFGCEDPESGQSLLPGFCELDGRRCHPDSNVCVDECDPLENGPDFANPGCAFWGYPASCACTTWTMPGRCVPGPCVLDPLAQGLDLSECLRFVRGQS